MVERRGYRRDEETCSADWADVMWTSASATADLEIGDVFDETWLEAQRMMNVPVNWRAVLSAAGFRFPLRRSRR